MLTRPCRAQALSARTASSSGSSASGVPSSPIRDYFLGSREASDASPYGTPRSQPEASPNASPLAQLPGAPFRAGLESLKASFEQQLVKLAAELQLRQDQAAQDLELRLERHAAQLDEGSRAERESMAEHIALLERTIEAASDESRSRVDASKRQLEGDLRALHLRAVHAENLAAENLGAYSDAVGRIPLLERQIGLLEQQLKENKAGADARAAELESTLQQAQSDLKTTILREIGAVKEAQQTATERQDAKIATVEAELLQRLTHGITTLRADTEAKLTSQNKKVTKELADAKSDAEDRHERISRQLATLEEDLTRRVSKELAEVRSAVETKAGDIDERLDGGLQQCEAAIEGKADVGFVKTLDMLVRQDLEESNTALQQVHEELGEQAEQIEKVEGRMEREEGEVSELSTDLGLMEAGIMANLMSVEMEQAELRESVTTQIAEEVGACKAASEDGAEVLRLEVQASLSGFKSEIDETVVRQMGSRISSSEAAVNGRVAAMEERVSEAASKTELKTQTGLIRIDLEEISTAIQAVDEMVNDDKAAEALDQRLEQLDGEPPLDANPFGAFIALPCTTSLIAF